ncbi:MAG: type II toxin-antitoxin system Phd/YefM family antitoxin [Treponema sp.]|nr:type II toxin-antitoxin system Phd/YefM family antitoxin [Treponema sp.]
MSTLVKTRKKDWQLQEAKAMFSEVIKATAVRPQTITIRGKEAAVILSIEEYKKLVHPRQSLYAFVQASPLRDLKLALPQRPPEKMREVW